MKPSFLTQFFGSSPAVRLLRSPNVAWITDFFYREFKASGSSARAHSELVVALGAFLSELGIEKEESAETYLNQWSSLSTGWLKRFIDQQLSEPAYQLTADVELVLSFLFNASQQTRFIGTETRLRGILSALDELSQGMAESPAERLRLLKAKKQAIEDEIAEIEATGSVNKLDRRQIRERFFDLVSQVEHLKGEFRAVEDRFKEITRSVQHRMLSVDESRSEILQFALDREDVLKETDQGRSFFEFIRLLHSPQSQQRIRNLIEQVTELDSLVTDDQQLEGLRSMVPTLISEAEKILRTTQHLSTTLRRLLDARSTRHHQRLSQVLRELLTTAAEQANHPPADIGLEVEVELDIRSPMDRPFWSQLEPFDSVELQLQEASPEQQQAAVEQLNALPRINWDRLRSNIQSTLAEQERVSILDVVEGNPIQLGAIEVLGYLQIAHEDGHQLNFERHMEMAIVDALGRQRTIRMPSIHFVSTPSAATVSIGQHENLLRDGGEMEGRAFDL